MFSLFSIPLSYAFNIAIQTEKETLTYQNLADQVEAKALDLQKQGVFAGSRVAFVAETSLSCIISLIALF
ncbi:MAG: hypothetical protein JSS09_04975, partial [Verrucomicrobia bacterium]|nr:hypothetical protein [Verrucomicrobiota bacterium]